MTETELPWAKQASLARNLACIAFLAGIAFSPNLWISDRFFPLLPVTGSLAALPHSFNYLLAGTFVLLLLAMIFVDRLILHLLLFLCLTVLLLQDLNRLQPWVYIYLLVLLPFCFAVKTPKYGKSVLVYLQIIFSGVYLWSGIHKINPVFIDSFFTEILTYLLRIKDPVWIFNLKPLGYLIPVTEILIGVFLFIPRLRRTGVFAALITHVIILLYLSPLGINANSVVYPWNLAMMGFVFLLFYKNNGPAVFWQGNYRLLKAGAFLLAWVLPVLNFWGYWDSYLSFSLYSGKANYFLLVVGNKALDKTDKRLVPYFENNNVLGGKIVEINKWSMAELNVPFYPETRALKKLARNFCGIPVPDDQLYFLEFEVPLRPGDFKRFTCSQVNHTVY